jgi:hypothetical protein
MTTDTNTRLQSARDLVEAAAAASPQRLAVESLPAAYFYEGRQLPLPCIVRDLATNRALHVRRETYPASRVGRISISAEWPKDAAGKHHGEPGLQRGPASVAPTASPASLARKICQHLRETQAAYDVAAASAAAADLSARQREETVAALVAAGWRAPYRPGKEPTAPDLPAGTYVFSERVEDDRVSLDIRRMTAAQAIAVLEILRAPAAPTV